jgi:hypothetical protein
MQLVAATVAAVQHFVACNKFYGSQGLPPVESNEV